MTVLSLQVQKPLDWQVYRARILTEWDKRTVQGYVQAGRWVEEALAKLTKTARKELQQKLPFSGTITSQLRGVAKHPILSDPAQAPVLPTSLNTLQRLGRLPEDVLIAGLRDGSIGPETSRSQAEHLLYGKPSKPYKRRKPKVVNVSPIGPVAILNEPDFQLSKEQRMRTVETLMRSLDLSVMDWISIKGDRPWGA